MSPTPWPSRKIISMSPDVFEKKNKKKSQHTGSESDLLLGLTMPRHPSRLGDCLPGANRWAV
jgi:hypothetical protein